MILTNIKKGKRRREKLISKMRKWRTPNFRKLNCKKIIKKNIRRLKSKKKKKIIIGEKNQLNVNSAPSYLLPLYMKEKYA